MWEIISGVIGVLGFVISVTEAFIRIRSNKRNLIFHLHSVHIRGEEEKDIIVRYQLENNSSSPITITNIELSICGVKYNCDYISRYATESTYAVKGKVIFHAVKGTDTLPINLAAHEAHGGHFSFPVPKDNQPNLGTPLTFQISTNRGKPVRMILSQGGDYRIR